MNVSRTRDVLGLVAFVVLSFGVATLGGVAVKGLFLTERDDGPAYAVRSWDTTPIAT